VQLRSLPELHSFDNARNSEGRLNTIDPVLNPRGSDLKSKNLNNLADRLTCEKVALSTDFREDERAAGVNAIRHNRDQTKK
jgi:hypothetical protein